MNYLNVFPADAARAAFAREFAVGRAKWSGHNLSRMLRLTGERPARVAEMRAILGDLGLGWGYWISPSGAFDHGEMWARAGLPSILVGHPYGIDADERRLLAELARFRVLRVAIDDRPSYYGFGSHHVRVELADPRRPFVPLPSTPQDPGLCPGRPRGLRRSV